GGEGISARVVDAYSVKPIDAATLRAAAAAAGNRVVVAEDHWPEGGLGDAVLEVFADVDTHTRVVCLAVSEMPGSGKPDDVLAAVGIDADAIAAAARKLVGAGGGPGTEYEPQQVPVNMYETHDALVLVAPLPGVMADDVEVTIEAGRVRIEAEMRTPAEKGYMLHEWHYGPFSRTVDIPQGFGAKAAATFGNGQLALRLERGDSPTDGKLVVHPS
ncbi:MAG TPA: transketolase C-terminal domain-containing protein, partial [Acidimicrobiales bacterium]|nr:transketolase C-terminal domain-containing protein [Acidimicrobiales bacterium]